MIPWPFRADQPLAMKASQLVELALHVRAVPDFPKPGVTFCDVSPLLADPKAFALSVEALAEPWLDARVDTVCGIDARGFIFGAALAQRLSAGFVPLRKPGKLPPPVTAVDYQLEYGSDRLEMAADIFEAGQRLVLIDDVLATGGTLATARKLVSRSPAHLLGASVVVELDALRGRDLWLAGVALHSLVHY